MNPAVKDPLFTRFAPRTTLAISAVTGGLILSAWATATALGWVAPLFLPSPGQVVTRLNLLITEGFADATLWQHTWASLVRVFSAFALACLTAVPVGILMGVHDAAKGLLDPLIEFYRPLPPLAYLPLIIIWLGIGETAKVVLIFLAMFAPICLSTRAGVRSVAREKVLAAATLGASRLQIIRHVILPGA
ncbi:MAG: ABC transporter permease subunit, partial [Myxococcota bacterium]